MNIEKLTTNLQHEMQTQYVSVNAKKNPIARALPQMTASDMAAIVGQYNHFPKNIVGFLNRARQVVTSAGWKEVEDELMLNACEEVGALHPENKSHYQMLLDGLEEGLDAKFDNIYACDATRNFVQTMQETMQINDPAYVAGAAYALEATAVPELQIVQTLVDTLFQKHTGAKIPKDSELDEFFEGHIQTWEVGHEDRLKTALTPYINAGNQGQFKEGFHKTMQTMDAWWTGMYEQVLHRTYEGGIQ